eukprot:1524658-Pyramimonas_sp.AAC.1
MDCAVGCPIHGLRRCLRDPWDAPCFMLRHALPHPWVAPLVARSMDCAVAPLDAQSVGCAVCGSIRELLNKWCGP